jgi:gliding motility-associated-like protein
MIAGSVVRSQPPVDWVASNNLGPQFQDVVTDVFVDASGNTYACGSFRGNMILGGFPLSTTTAGQAFVVKYNSAGIVQWALQSSSDHQVTANAIFVDNVGSTYITGFHSSDTLLFSGLFLPSVSNEGLYVLKINSNGAPFHLTGPTNVSSGKCQSWGITGDNDNVYITGSHKGAVAFPGGQNLPATQGGEDVFVAKIDSALSAFSFAFSHGGTGNEKGRSIIRNGNELFAIGDYEGSPTFIAPGPDYVLPDYGNRSVWLAEFNTLSGDLQWANSAGSSTGPSIGYDLTMSGPSLIIAGSASDNCEFSDSPSPTGPFSYSNAVSSNGGLDIFGARYNSAGAVQAVWSEGGPGNDEAFGITADPTCGQVQLCGYFEDSVNFGGSNMLKATGKDQFVAAYDNSGFYFWAFNEISEGDDIAHGIMANNGRSAVGGEHSGTIIFNTDPMTELDINGFNDHFVTNFLCAATEPCGPQIDCPPNDTILSTVTCDFPTPDYSGVTVIDGCSGGIASFTQDPLNATILNVGSNLITLEAVDIGGNSDYCLFNVVVVADNSPVVVNCGDSFIDETTGNSSNSSASFTCNPITTPGQDLTYQITVPQGNQFIQVKMDNVVDSNDPYAYVYWLGTDCPNGGSCVVEVDSFDITAGKFSNNSQFLTFPADGPNTYFLVVDAATDSIQSYDLEFFCISGGIELDTSDCLSLDPDNDGLLVTANLSTVDLTFQPCETVSICHDLFIKNEFDWQWVDSVEFKLGDCYENINPASISSISGQYDIGGSWDAVYNAGTNSIVWEFTHSTGNPWGDGSTGLYGCNQYNFCFEADITSNCPNSEGLNIGIVLGDDGGKGFTPDPPIFTITNSNNFVLQDDDPFFTYPANVLCDGDPDVLPDSITTTGGSFTATAGIVFTDGSPSSSGEIDLTNSTIGGPYTITYEVGLCPFTHDFIVDINAQEDPAFNFGAAAYCQGDTDPTPTITGTPGGTFTAPTEVVFISQSTGQIDLDASTAGGPYYIVYTTPGPNCINADSVQITINAEDDPTFSYAANEFCQGDTDPLPTINGTTGGTFSVLGGLTLLSAATGEIDVSASTLGGPYTVEYTTPGPDCPNTGNFQISINAEDDPTFNYPTSAYCQGDANPTATISGTGGGTFSGPVEVSFVSTATGEIDLAGSTAGGPYVITYTTPGPDCPNSATFNITINSEDDPSFSYTTTDFCAADANQIPTINGTGGGTFNGPLGISFVDINTGEIDVTASTLGGPYTITYTTPGPNCPNSSDVQITIYDEDDATINYAITSFCPTDTDPVPTINTAGGSFTAPSEITFINTTTGEIDLDGSTAGGPYEVVYTSPGPECPNTDTAFITITPQDDPTFNYLSSDFCAENNIEAVVVIGTTGGTFTADPELDIDSGSGTVNIANSTIGGPYSIKYVTAGTCPDSSEINVSIYPSIIADAGPDQNLVLVDQTNLEANTLPTTDSGTWTIISGSADISDVNDPLSLVTNLPNGTTEFLWSVNNPGCPQKIDTVAITAGELFIPQAITPNNDGNNDLFVINGMEDLENTVEIFNRWGQKVYVAENYQNNWDGTSDNGEELSADTYYYIINVESTTYKGFVVIKR